MLQKVHNSQRKLYLHLNSPASYLNTRSLLLWRSWESGKYWINNHFQLQRFPNQLRRYISVSVLLCVLSAETRISSDICFKNMEGWHYRHSLEKCLSKAFENWNFGFLFEMVTIWIWRQCLFVGMDHPWNQRDHYLWYAWPRSGLKASLSEGRPGSERKMLGAVLVLTPILTLHLHSAAAKLTHTSKLWKVEKVKWSSAKLRWRHTKERLQSDKLPREDYNNTQSCSCSYMEQKH